MEEGEGEVEEKEEEEEEERRAATPSSSFPFPSPTKETIPIWTFGVLETAALRSLAKAKTFLDTDLA